MGRTSWILGGLVAGVVLGAALRAFAGPGLIGAAEALQPLGQLWLNALQMTLVPLVFCLMVSGAGAVARTNASGRLIGVTVILFLVLLVVAAALGALLSFAFAAVWPVQAGARALLHGSVTAPPTPPVVEQLLAFIPVNPVAAAAKGAMTPLIVFAALFGAAAAQLRTPAAESLLHMVGAAGEALLTIVGWVLLAAPVGVFLLALNAVLHAGLGLAAALFQYVAMMSAVLAVGLVCTVLIGAFGGGVSLARFARAAFGPQAVAVSTQSSMASLPSLLKAAGELGLPPALIDAVMPLAVSTFRFGNVMGAMSAGLVAAWLCGIHPSLLQIALAAGVAVLTNIGVMGLPAVAMVFAAYGPVFIALGAPLEMITLLLAVITLPDMLDTASNVTADLAATAIVARLNPEAATAVVEA